VPASVDDAQTRGVAVTVLSASGGCGATTLAINLADALHQAGASSALLVDMDNVYGAVSQYLGLKTPYGLADVLDHSDVIDSQLVRSSLHSHTEHLRVLASPAGASFAAPAPLQYDRLDRALEVFKQVSPYTVIDAPRVSMDVAATLAKRSKITLIALQLNVKDVRMVQAMLVALRERGVAAEHILPLANRSQAKNAMVSMEDAQRVLGIPVGRLSNDYRAAIQAMNYGQLLREAAPRSDLTRDIAELARKIYKATEDNVPVAP
jgi:pilus assembly protein CpaE